MKRVSIPLAVVAVCLLMHSTAGAAQWQFYGSARMTTFFAEASDLRPDSAEALSSLGLDQDLRWDIQINSRVGANVNHGPVSGRFEFGTGVNLRHLYGVWDYGEGQLLVGQSYTPLGSYFYSNQVFNADSNLFLVGQIYSGRRPMIQLTMGGFKVALVSPQAATDLGTGGDVKTIYPKLEVSMYKAWDNAFLDIFGGYQTYEIKDGTNDLDVEAYAYGLGAGFTLGPGYVKGGFYIAQNAGQYGLANFGMSDALISDGRLVNNTTIGGLVVIGCKLSDVVTVEAGAGMTQHELDDDRYSRDENLAYYIQLPLTLAPGVKIVPEVGLYDYREDIDGFDAGDYAYAGAKWQVDF